MRDACGKRMFCDWRFFGSACLLLALASLTLASCAGRDPPAGDAGTSAPARAKAATTISEKEAADLAKKEFLKSGGGLNATDCRVTAVKPATIQHEPVWIVTIKHQAAVVTGDPQEVIIDRRTRAAHFAPKKN
jgi:hypothetical protein